MLHFVEDPCPQLLEHMEVPSGDHQLPMRLDCCRECENWSCKRVHICRSSVDAVCRPLSLWLPNLARVSLDVPKPGLVRAGQEALLHCLTMIPP